jgi:predicted transcriptional regulator of viral defense system
MTKLDLVKNVLTQFGGIAKTSDFVAAGVTKQELGEFCKAGELERIRQGYYQLAGNFSISEAQYLRALLPEGIVCVESALFYYGYSDFAPRVWTLAVPRSISLAKLKIDVVPIKAYYIQNNLHEIGKTFAPFDGTDLAIYDRDRTICDCFKYRTKLDSETFSKAINGYVADDEKNLGNLSLYSKELGLYKRVMDLMEVMLNG